MIDVELTIRNISDTTINRNLADVRAAFRFCMDRPTIIKLLKAQAREGGKKPTLSMEQMVKLFDYAFESDDRSHLQAYLVTAISTLGRPDAILDICVAPERQQIEWDFNLLHLNPAGRLQNRKFRASVPINCYLLPYLYAAKERFEDDETESSGYIIEYKSDKLASMRQTWNRAKVATGLPMTRDYDAKMIRHTMGKWLRSQGVVWQELQGHMGHKIPGMTEGYAEYDPSYMGTVQKGINQYFQEIERHVKHPINQGYAHTSLTAAKNIISIKYKNNK